MAEQKMNEVTEETVNEAAEAEKTVETNETAEPIPEAETEKTEPEYEPMTLTAEEVKALKEKLTKLQEDRDDAIRQAQRLQAEFENYRKRNATLVADSRDDGVRDAVKNMLPVLDNFDRALETEGDDPFARGVRNIKKQFEDALKKCGAEEIDASGKFDPKLHDAVMQDSVEDKESGDITAVLQKGWKVKGKIVRYSMVKVNN